MLEEQAAARVPELVPVRYGRMGVSDHYHERDLNEFPVPATYIVDSGGVVRYAYVHADWRQRSEAEELLAALKDIHQERAS